MSENREYGDDEFIDGGFVHLRMKSGFEVIGNLVYTQVEYDSNNSPSRKSFILDPVRASVDVTDRGISVKLLPYSSFSNDDTFFFDMWEAEFLVKMDDNSIDTYFKFLNQYKLYKEGTSEPNDEDENSVEKRVLH